MCPSIVLYYLIKPFAPKYLVDLVVVRGWQTYRIGFRVRVIKWVSSKVYTTSYVTEVLLFSFPSMPTFFSLSVGLFVCSPKVEDVVFMFIILRYIYTSLGTMPLTNFGNVQGHRSHCCQLLQQAM